MQRANFFHMTLGKKVISAIEIFKYSLQMRRHFRYQTCGWSFKKITNKILLTFLREFSLLSQLNEFFLQLWNNFSLLPAVNTRQTKIKFSKCHTYLLKLPSLKINFPYKISKYDEHFNGKNNHPVEFLDLWNTFPLTIAIKPT